MPQQETERFMRRAEVEEMVALKTSAIYEMTDRGAFPRPIRVGSKAVR